MADDEKMKLPRTKRPSSHMPDTALYEKVIPALLIGLGVVTVGLILVAAGIAVGVIPY